MKLLRFFLKVFLYLYFVIGIIFVILLFSEEDIYFTMHDIFFTFIILFAPGLFIIGGISNSTVGRFWSGIFYFLFFFSFILLSKIYPFNELIEPIEKYETDIIIEIIGITATIYFFLSSILIHFTIDDDMRIRRRKKLE